MTFHRNKNRIIMSDGTVETCESINAAKRKSRALQSQGVRYAKS
jgi:hypothetical protein